MNQTLFPRRFRVRSSTSKTYSFPGHAGCLLSVHMHIPCSLNRRVLDLLMSLWICVIHTTRDMCFPGGGTHVTRDICFPGGGTHITRNMCFPTWDLLLICIHSNDGKYFYVYLGMLTNLLLLLFLLGHHTSPELPGETASFCFGVLKNLLITYIHL